MTSKSGLFALVAVVVLAGLSWTIIRAQDVVTLDDPAMQPATIGPGSHGAVSGGAELDPQMAGAPENPPLHQSQGYYEDWPSEDIAQDLMKRYRERGSIAGEPTIHRLVDIYGTDAEGLGAPEIVVASGGEPDLAIVMEGTFSFPMLGRSPRTMDQPYMVVVVDRDTGKVWTKRGSTNLQNLLDMLPPP